MWLSRDMAAILLERKWSTNCYMLDAKGSLLISIYVHSILPHFHLHLVLSLIMPTFVNLFVLFGSVYKMWLLVFSNLQISWAFIK